MTFCGLYAKIIVIKSHRETLDPDHNLPLVALKAISSHDFGYIKRDKLAILTEDEQVGEFDLVLEVHDASRFAHFDGIEINENQRGKGIVLASYILAIEMSHASEYDFETQNYELTQHSK